VVPLWPMAYNAEQYMASLPGLTTPAREPGNRRTHAGGFAGLSDPDHDRCAAGRDRIAGMGTARCAPTSSPRADARSKPPATSIPVLLDNDRKRSRPRQPPRVRIPALARRERARTARGGRAPRPRRIAPRRDRASSLSYWARAFSKPAITAPGGSQFIDSPRRRG